MVNLDFEPDTNDLRFNEHEEMGNRLDVEGEGSEEEKDDSEGWEGSEEENEEVSEEIEESSEEGEGGEENEESSEEGEGSEDERCKASRRFLKRFADRAREDSEKDESEGGEGSEENEEGSEENEESSEEGETDEGSEDERCEASPRFTWQKQYVARLASRVHEVYDEDELGEEYEEFEGSEEVSEKDESEGEEGSEENEDGSEENEESSEEGETDEGSEDERCEASPRFKWQKQCVPLPAFLLREVYFEDELGEEYEEFVGSEEVSEKDESEGEEGSEEGSEGEKDEESEDERCEASPIQKRGKMFVEHEEAEVEGNEQGSEDRNEDEDDGKYETREASPCFDFGKASVVRPTSEEHEEDEDGEEDKIVEEPEEKESERDEESDICDSEINEYKEAVHKLLKFRTYKVKGPNGQLRCPFCVDQEKQDYNRLLEHAVRVAEGPTDSAKQRANHSAMAKYLVIDFANDVEQPPLSANKLLHSLTLELDSRKENMDQLLSKYEEKTVAIRKILEEKDETQHTFFEEARNMLCIARDQAKRVLEQDEMLSFDFENKRRRLNSWSQELNKREAALTEEKRKMDDLMREKNDLYRRPNDELLEAGKELMKGLEDMPSHCCVKIGVKRRRGEIDEKAFMDECKKRYMLNEAEIEAFEQYCFWVKTLRDDKVNPQGLLNENEKLLRALKDKWDSKIYNAVIEYNTNNGNSAELWNFEEDRKASHCEVIRHVFLQWKTLQCKRDDIDEIIKMLI